MQILLKCCLLNLSWKSVIKNRLFDCKVYVKFCSRFVCQFSQQLNQSRTVIWLHYWICFLIVSVSTRIYCISGLQCYYFEVHSLLKAQFVAKKMADLDDLPIEQINDSDDDMPELIETNVVAAEDTVARKQESTDQFKLVSFVHVFQFSSCRWLLDFCRCLFESYISTGCQLWMSH